ncbi:2TM domain-containing protein [Sphingosinicella rhizophila]|uniref:2TM domain-containing protein n=1 Tax=Sphingosinicella rhizophila TaxID=3050082 RepID=A0ABU3Q6G8_9SPHN|nr:2TM domain-containing protein [Sphingosinicella sp. GR2756]MDT9599002.1 2TM domain-containing protein [Sphingosinicella sp. GR2756]
MDDAVRRTLRMIRRNAGLRGYFAHMILFAIVILAALTSGLEWRLFWPLVGWTIGLFLHGLAAIGPGQFLGGAWEEERLRSLSDEGRLS